MFYSHIQVDIAFVDINLSRSFFFVLVFYLKFKQNIGQAN